MSTTNFNENDLLYYWKNEVNVFYNFETMNGLRKLT